MKGTIYLIAGIIGVGLLLACGNTKNGITMASDFSSHPSKKEADFSMMAPDSSWMVSYISGEQLIFTDLTNKKQVIIDSPKEEVAAGADIITIVGESNKEKLSLTIDVARCKPEGYLSTLTYNDKQYEGCGQYQGHRNLFVEWQPMSMNGKPVQDDFFKNKQPILRFNDKEDLITGNGGCNTFTGKISFSYNSFATEGLISTKMYCEPESQFEEVLMNLLGAKKVVYSFQNENNELLLEIPGTSIQFKKVSQL